MRASRVAVDKLLQDPANVRQHSAKNIETIKASLARFGQQKPIVVDGDGVVVAGNGTLAAARELGWQKVHVVRSALQGADRTAYAIADNRTAELAEWDDAALAEQLSALAIDDDELLAAAGFDEAELERLVNETTGLGADDVIEDEAPEPPADPVTNPGDLWQLGEHRVLCGDCRISSDVSALLGSTKINVAFTSPPYASQRKYDESSGFKPIRPDGYVEWFDAVQANVAAHLATDGSWFVNIKEHCEDGQRHLYVKDLTVAHVRTWHWKFIDEFAWTKSGVPGKWPNRFKNAWEPVFHFAMCSNIRMRHDNVTHFSADVLDYHPDNPKTHSGFLSSGQSRRSGLALPSNVIVAFNSPKQTDTGKVKHEATFPVDLPSFFIKAYSDPGDAIFDPFLGSGTTLIAAEQLGRRCYGMELSPSYCDVIVERWENLTGKKAKRVADG